MTDGRRRRNYHRHPDAERLRQLDASEARLKGRFDADLKLWAQEQAKAALAEIAITAGFVKTSADLAAYKKHGAEWLEKTGELLPGLTIRERSESLSIKFGEEKATPEPE